MAEETTEAGTAKERRTDEWEDKRRERGFTFGEALIT